MPSADSVLYQEPCRGAVHRAQTAQFWLTSLGRVAPSSRLDECREKASYAARKSGLRCRVTVLGIVHACTGKFPF